MNTDSKILSLVTGHRSPATDSRSLAKRQSRDRWESRSKYREPNWALCLLITCHLCLLVLIGCVRKIDYFEGAPLSAPARLAQIPHPAGQCGPYCVKIRRAVLIKHPLDRIKQLKDIARSPDLSLHEQLYLINATLNLEMFGIAEVFKELAIHPHLRYTARKYLLSYTNRLSTKDAEPITKLLLQNPGVPDKLTAMERLWSGCFNIDYRAILDLYREGASTIPPRHASRRGSQVAEEMTDEIMTTYYLSRVASKKPVRKSAPKSFGVGDCLSMIRKWRNGGDSWYVIILKRLGLDPAIIFAPLPPQKGIPEPFYGAYHSYWLGLSKKTPLSDVIVNRLIQLKVVVTYYDLAPIEVMKEIAGGKTFDEIIRDQTKKPHLPKADLSH